MDAFFAAVEEQRNPALKGRPVIIGGRGDPSKRGVVSTANYEARKYGVHSAMPLRTAYRLCPHAVFLPVDYEAYLSVSRRFKRFLLSLTTIMEDVGIDEVFLDATDLTESSEELVNRIKTGIRKETGLTCSVGVAPNKLLAKIASDMEKPDGMTLIAMDDVERRIWPMGVRKLYGIGPRTEIALGKIGIETIGQLAALSVEELVKLFGKSYGRYLYFASRGLDDSPIVTHWEPKSFSRESTFQEDVKNWQTLARMLAELTREAVADMKSHAYLAGTFTVKIRFSDFHTLTRAKTIHEDTDNEEQIRKIAFACLKRIDLNKPVRLIGIRLSNLHKRE